jgi:hypothetical protein
VLSWNYIPLRINLLRGKWVNAEKPKLGHPVHSSHQYILFLIPVQILPFRLISSRFLHSQAGGNRIAIRQMNSHPQQNNRKLKHHQRSRVLPMTRGNSSRLIWRLSLDCGGMQGAMTSNCQPTKQDTVTLMTSCIQQAKHGISCS